MTQEQFEKMCELNKHIKSIEDTLVNVDFSSMEMCFGRAPKPNEPYRDDVNAAYYGLIPKEERDKLTAEMRERLKAVLTQRINELKAEFEKL